MPWWVRPPGRGPAEGVHERVVAGHRAGLDRAGPGERDPTAEVELLLVGGLELRFQLLDDVVQLLHLGADLLSLRLEVGRRLGLLSGGTSEPRLLAPELLGHHRDPRGEVGVPLHHALCVLEPVGRVLDRIGREERADRERATRHEGGRDPVVQAPLDPRELALEPDDLCARIRGGILRLSETRLGLLPEPGDPIELGSRGLQSALRRVELGLLRPRGDRGQRGGPQQEGEQRVV